MTAHVEGQQCRQQADRKHPAPAVHRHHHGCDDGRRRIACRERALDPRHHLAAVLGRPGLADQRRTGRPFPANAQANDDPEQHQLAKRV